MAYPARGRAMRRPRRRRCAGPVLPAWPYRSMDQLEADRGRRDAFMRGSGYAAAALCGMFAVLSLGAVFLGW